MGRILILIAPVPGYCLLFIFKESNIKHLLTHIIIILIFQKTVALLWKKIILRRLKNVNMIACFAAVPARGEFRVIFRYQHM